MKILYISQYFHPEVCAPTNRALANVRYLADKKHDVTVLTEMPNHPEGIIHKEYRKKLFKKEIIDNYTVYRVWIFTSVKKSFVTRILFYLSFMLFGFLATLCTWKKYDIIYVTSPPLFVGAIGLLIKKIHPKVKFVFEVRDLWPDVAIEMGELNNKSFIRFSKKLEMDIYNNADKIIPVTNYFKDRIVNKGVFQDKLYVIRNGTDISFLDDDYDNDPQNTAFSVIYAGNLGIAQNVSIVINAASILRDKQINFIIAGKGPEEKKIHTLAQELKLDNIQFIGEIPKINIGKYLRNADCGIIPLRNIETFKGTIPSKIFDYMAFNLPILIGVDGEARKIVEDSGTGLFFIPEDCYDLAEKILYLKKNPDILNEMSSKGNSYVRKNFNRIINAQILEKKLMELLGKK